MGDGWGGEALGSAALEGAGSPGGVWPGSPIRCGAEEAFCSFWTLGLCTATGRASLPAWHCPHGHPSSARSPRGLYPGPSTRTHSLRPRGNQLAAWAVGGWPAALGDVTVLALPTEPPGHTGFPSNEPPAPPALIPGLGPRAPPLRIPGPSSDSGP